MEPEETPQLQEDFFYDKNRKEYLRCNKRGCWLSLAENQFRKELANRGLHLKCLDGENVSQVDEFIIQLRDTHDVDYVGPLAGYTAGFQETNGHRLLVTDSPRIIEPIAGDWSTLKAVLSGLLADDAHDQLRYLYGWLKVGYQALRSRQRRPGQALALTGPHDCGKSLLQQIVTLIFGGRSAKPYAFMTDATTFNGDLFEAEHLCIEDEPASTDIRTRRAFGAKIKQVTACDTQYCHAKHRQAVTLTPFWRLTISLNDEPENLMVLPPIDDSIEDKIILLRAVKVPMPMPTTTHKEREAFWSQLVTELPAFLYFLCHWRIPKRIQSERYGITHFLHPTLLREIDALSPEFRLLTILEAELFRTSDAKPWQGTAEYLGKRLTGEGGYMNEAQKLLNWNNSTGTYLGRLAKKYPDRFQQERRSDMRRWTIHPPKSR